LVESLLVNVTSRFDGAFPLSETDVSTSRFWPITFTFGPIRLLVCTYTLSDPPIVGPTKLLGCVRDTVPLPLNVLPAWNVVVSSSVAPVNCREAGDRVPRTAGVDGETVMGTVTVVPVMTGWGATYIPFASSSAE
jgi:hypothetical protein